MKDVIFDLYGTLINIYTNEHSKAFWRRVSSKFKKYKCYKPKHLRNEYLRICAEMSKQIEEIDLLEVFKQLYDADDDVALKIAKDFRRISIKKIKIYKGAYKLLDELNKKGYRIFLLSNAQDCFTRYELHKFNIDKFFTDIAISSNYGIKKPNKEFLLRLMQKNGIKDAIMIGNDYVCDILPASEIGLKTIYLETETSRETLNVEKIKGFNRQQILLKVFSYK